MNRTFIWRGTTFQVRFHEKRYEYRDAAHLGGPWSKVIPALDNTSLDRSFRNALAKAVGYPKVTARQEGGDDGYCWVVRVNGHEFVNGLTRNEVPGYKAQALRDWEAKQTA